MEVPEVMRTYEQYLHESTLYVFDLDDTLVDTPSFGDHAAPILERIDVLSHLERAARAADRPLSDIHVADGRVYIDDPESIIPAVKGLWYRKKGRLYLTTPDGYYTDELSVPTEIRPDIVAVYRTAPHRAIVTGRGESSRLMVNRFLRDLGIPAPDMGLHMFPGTDLGRTAAWKANTIIGMIRTGGFSEAHYYEDNAKWLKWVTMEAARRVPDVRFVPHKVDPV